MSEPVTFPRKTPCHLPYSRLREQVEICPPVYDRQRPTDSPLRVASFNHNSKDYVLVKDLAALWNFPSSYQVIARLTRRSGIPKNELVHVSDQDLNAFLAEHGVISESEAKVQLFYVELTILCLILVNLDSIYESDGVIASAERESLQKPDTPSSDDDSITLAQVFPNYGAVEDSLPLTHATFLSLTPLTKLHVYKHEGNYRKVYGTALSAHERELITQSSNHILDGSVPGSQASSGSSDSVQKSKKPLGRSKKFVGNVDPNQLDVSESVLPGCGYIPEFNVNALCKVPNYFVLNKEMSAQLNSHYQPARSHMAGLSTKGKKPSDMPKQLYQLLSNTDQEAYHFKYYYFKSYRGPGSGNYKDAALVNRINKIKRFTPETAPTSNNNTHLSANKVTKPLRKRGDSAIKGLTHEYFSNENVEIVVERQRRFAEDFENLEMLHNNVLFNLLVNGYREVSRDTWNAFYKFKAIDYEKEYSRKQKDLFSQKHAELVAKGANPQEIAALTKANLSSRFSLPSDYPEIMEKLPCELRGDDEDPAHSLSEPVRYVARYPDKSTPGMLNQIEVIKLPNANSIAWDNLRKYRRE